MESCDILILGSGIGGLAFAMQIVEQRLDISVHLYTKGDIMETNTRYAQGGIAGVTDFVSDSLENHVYDTMEAGKGYCKEHVVRSIIEMAPERVEDLVRWGVLFDREIKGKWKLGLEGGHSHPRILHCKDQTGLAILQALMDRIKGFGNVKLYPWRFVTDLLVRDNKCYGVRYIDPSGKEMESCYAKLIFLATGGSGQVFKTTTNPLIATGDGVAMAAKAGAKIQDMPFYQFHPTALSIGSDNPSFLISEAVRGTGAHIVNKQGERFLFRYHCKGELATRDIVSHAIFLESAKEGEEYVYLDCRHLDKGAFKKLFPSIMAHCLKLGLDLFKTPIPIMPAAHYQCGGILVDLYGRTTIKNLYANGECACTGMHGANRLASNSLLEAIAIAYNASKKALLIIDDIIPTTNGTLPKKSPIGPCQKPILNKINLLKTQLREAMYAHYKNKVMDRAAQGHTYATLTTICHEVGAFQDGDINKELYELKSMASVAQMML